MQDERPRQKALQVVLLALSSISLLFACGESEENSGGVVVDKDQDFTESADLLDESTPFASTAVPAAPSPNPCAAADRKAAAAIWTKLRQVDYPYHLQTVALSPRFRSGCRALIIAEPPPAITLQSLQAVAPQLLATSETLQHQIGYDGWTRDVVVTLPPVEDAELKELVAALHETLFGTTYRMQALDTSAPAPRYDAKTAALDVAVGPGDLNRWLLEGSGRFTPILGGEPAPFKDLLSTEEPDVYVDAANGLVAWIIPRKHDIAQMEGLFRQFTLESDVIVGAVASSTTVAIVARQRVVDPRLFQPLRFETVSLLAAANKEGLGQSYDRNHTLAGRIDRTRDWAPIFLSPELLDTEYGSLLDIADQFLKSWSMNGKVKYINFKYPDPPQWAFPAPVFLIAKAASLRFNWNTTNVGAVVDVSGLDVFWIRRTGALNVSYFPDEVEGEAPADPSVATRALEEKAYQFFTKTQTPMLARVVQYNALYQIFIRFDLTSSQKLATEADPQAMRPLKIAAIGALKLLRDADEPTLRRRLEGFVRDNEQHIRTLIHREILKLVQAYPGADISPDHLDELERQSLAEQNVAGKIMDEVRQLSATIRSLDYQEFNELVGLLGAPREAKDIRESVFRVYKQIKEAEPMFARFANPQIYKEFAATIQPKSETWIHTPSIVISWSEINAVGGHELSPKIATLKFQRDVPSIAAEQMAQKKMVSEVGATELDRLVLGQQGPTLAKAADVRPPRLALGISDRHPLWPAPAEPPTVPRPASGDLYVKRVKGGYEVVETSGTRREVATMPEVVELVGSRRGVKNGSTAIRFDGFSTDEARVLMRTAEVKMHARLAGVTKGRARLAGITKDTPEFANHTLDFSKAQVSKPQIRSFPDGAAQIGISIKVPTAATAPLSIRIKATFKQATPAWLQGIATKIRQAVNNVINRFRGRTVTPKEVGLALQQELKDLLPELDRLGVTLQRELADLTIVQLEKPVHRGTTRHAG
jgi:hypothetical protein